MSSAQGRGGEGISSGGELLASKWCEIELSSSPVSWNATSELLVVGAGEWFRRMRSRNLTQASSGRKRHCPHRCELAGRRTQQGWELVPYSLTSGLQLLPTAPQPSASAPSPMEWLKDAGSKGSYQKDHCPSTHWTRVQSPGQPQRAYWVPKIG